jgi:hypothetical protein
MLALLMVVALVLLLVMGVGMGVGAGVMISQGWVPLPVHTLSQPVVTTRRI